METEVIKALQEIIRKHTVRYEVWPLFEISEGKRVMVGFDIELYGTHDHGTTRLSPGWRYVPQNTSYHYDVTSSAEEPVVHWRGGCLRLMMRLQCWHL